MILAGESRLLIEEKARQNDLAEGQYVQAKKAFKALKETATHHTRTVFIFAGENEYHHWKQQRTVRKAAVI